MLMNLSVDAQLNQRFYGIGGALVNQQLGVYVSNVTVDAAWRDIQYHPAWSYVWTNLDSSIHANQNAGLRTMITLKCTSPITAADTTIGSCAYQLTTQLSDNGTSWWPYDTTEWKRFVDSLVDRYDGNGPNDVSWLDTNYRITQWHIGQEWQRIWCSQYPTNSLSTAQEFTNYVNMTYAVIKNQEPLSQISFAGLDTRHDLEVYYDGYSSQATTCVDFTCNNAINITNPSQLTAYPGFLAQRENVLYILRNARSDEIDIHQYGHWTEIPYVVHWLKDSANLGNRKVVFYEGGGPFCKGCDSIYHNVNDSDGRLPAPLLRDNASYVVYYYITGFASGVTNMHWHPAPEYNAVLKSIWGDLDLLTMNYIYKPSVPKPSAYVYRFLAKTIFSNVDADTVVRMADSTLYHYQVKSSALVPFIDVVWSTNPIDSLVVNGTGNLYTWDIPITCDSLYPSNCDSVFPMNVYAVSGSHTILLNDGVPVFFSWNNVLGENSSIVEENTSVNVYPNPFSETTTFEITNSATKNYEIRIYDLFGREVKKYEIKNQTTEISRDELPSGMYIYQVMDDKNQFISSGKLMVQ